MTPNQIVAVPLTPTTHHLETGSTKTAANLRELENQLAAALHAVRFFGTEGNTLAARSANWHGQWDDVTKIILRIRGGVDTMMAILQTGGEGGRTRAFEAWDTIQSDNGQLVQALKVIRTQVGQLSLADRKEWNVLARALGLHLEAIHGCAQTLRLKLERSGGSSNQSPAEGAAAPPYDHDDRDAALQLDREHHEFSGIKDIAKSLLMWSETPDERMRKNRSLVVDET
jgi:hypothetical protein